MSVSASGTPEWLALEDGEQVWLRASPSRNLVLVALAAGFALLIAMSVVVSTMDDVWTGRAISLTVLLVIVGLLVAAVLVTKRSEYVLTSDRICTGVGLRSKRVESVDLADVRDATVEQSPWQQVVNVGTLRFVANGDDLTFTMVRDPSVLHQQALQFVDVET